MADAHRFMLQHNPLGIRSLDGTEIVVGKAPRHSTVSIQCDDMERTFEGMQAKPSYYDSASDDSIPTESLDDDENEHRAPASLAELGISSASKTNVGLRNVQLDFGSDLASKFSTNFSSQLGSQSVSAKSSGHLGRKNTISARPMPPSESTPAGLSELRTSLGPSTNPLLIQRLKSIRKQLKSGSDIENLESNDYADDVQRAEALPDDVLKMIAFSPDSPWLGSDLAGFDDLSSSEEYDPADSHKDQAPEITRKSSRRNKKVLSHWSGSPASLNPFTANKENKEKLINISPSVTTLSSLSETEDICASAKPNALDDSPEAIAQPRPRVELPPSIEETDPVLEDDRGRLFLQINKFANLRGLPVEVPRNPKFTLSLDNGLQTVTTEPVPLPSPGFNGLLGAKIGQEFELTVAKDLELVLTIAVTMDAAKPPVRPRAPPRSPQRLQAHGPKHSSSSSNDSIGGVSTASTSPIKSMKNLLLRSPRKKQQAKFQEQEIQERQRQIQLEEAENERSRKQHELNLREFQNRADVWRNLTGPHGEYCRGYVFESHYEKDIYGRARSFAVPLYNEWDKSTDGVPRPVCELQVTMMYVPKLYGSEKIPMSMLQCQAQLESARKKRITGCEGYLTQQGGDCGNIWRRRYFTLKNSELIGHHEATKKRRALIHLDRAISVRDTLSEDLWCIYEDRSFQITFDDGEAIGFYADSIEARDVWLKALRDCVANSTGQHRSWTDLVFEAQENTSA